MNLIYLFSVIALTLNVVCGKELIGGVEHDVLPRFNINTPRVGSYYYTSSTQSVCWDGSGYDGVDGAIKIHHVTGIIFGRGIEIQLGVAKNMDGIFTWNVPVDLPTGAYMVRIVALKPTDKCPYIYDQSPWFLVENRGTYSDFKQPTYEESSLKIFGEKGYGYADDKVEVQDNVPAEEENNILIPDIEVKPESDTDNSMSADVKEEEIQTPDVEEIQTPEDEEIQTPEDEEIQTPEGEEIQTPGVDINKENSNTALTEDTESRDDDVNEESSADSDDDDDFYDYGSSDIIESL